MPRPRSPAARAALVGTVFAVLALAPACTPTDATTAPTPAPPATGSIPPTAVTSTEASAVATPTPPTTLPPFVATTVPAPPALRPVEPPTCATAVADRLPAPPTTPLPAPVLDPAPAPAAGTPSDPGPGPTPSEATTTTTAPVDAPTATSLLVNDPRLRGSTVAASVWADGLGEIAAVNPDAPQIPASNQKLLTAMGALRLLDPQERLHTDLVATGPVVDGVLHGDLVLVGGGDPTLGRAGDHSLATFAQAVHDAGIRAVDGRLLVDDTRYDRERTRPSWPADWWRSMGVMSSVVADRNSYRQDAAFRDDPALANAQLLEYALTTDGITFGGPTDHGTAPGGGALVLRLDSPTINELVTVMLLRSDNLIAELLVKEIGARELHASGTTDAGLAAIAGVIQQLCVAPIQGVAVDGSGLSRDDRRSPRELRRLLLAVQLQPWGPLFLSDLSMAGQPGALGGRLLNPETAGNVRAKGGSLAVSRALSGYLTTRTGRHVVFSIIVNGGALDQADKAIDDFVVRLASLRT